MKNNIEKENLGVDENKTHYYESNSPITIPEIPNHKQKIETHYYRYGWICPKCGAVMAPDQKTCVYCAPAFDIKVNF